MWRRKMAAAITPKKKRSTNMKTNSLMILYVAIVTACTAFTSTAHAQCSSMSPKAAVAWQHLPSYAPALRALAPPERADAEDRGTDVSIVGLWKVTFFAGGQVVDQAFEVFHNDGTELMIDTAPPASDNVCVGVWAKTDSLVKLNHPSWTFDANGNLNGTATIKVSVALDHTGNSFTGTFTVDVFSLTGVNLQHLAGTVSGQRITVD
jgi:hypothetical protein